MEEEAREILKDVLVENAPPGLNLAQSIRRHIDPLGGAELVLPARQPARRPPKLTR
jgi:plasmid stability protein